MKTTQKKLNVRFMATTAILAAASSVLMMFSFSVPFMPSFIKMDFSEFPALIASFSMGPWAGVAVCLIKNLVNLPMSTTGCVGELSNFLLGCMFVIPAGLLYRRKPTRKTALLGSVLGAGTMALASLPINYYVTYPVYSKFLPVDKIVAMYQAILPGVDSLFECLLIFNVPYTFLKGALSTVLTFLVYKRISRLIKGKG